ncbi:hypothetical protein Acr_00g0001850 [Actinidia rufa]|uniref:Uncharacterized protein n=1 Tax=Actinidia rufa TaxID=165716 RepID=A0A7J0D8F0_9ERIC|nr:hypothetical protein Acr_00g0001850 [Actinidia rufa]
MILTTSVSLQVLPTPSEEVTQPQDPYVLELDTLQATVAEEVKAIFLQVQEEPLPDGDKIHATSNQVMEEVMEWDERGAPTSLEEEKVQDSKDILDDLRANSYRSAFYKEVRRRLTEGKREVRSRQFNHAC